MELNVVEVVCGNILQLRMAPPQVDVKDEGQTALREFHVTLARLDDQGVDGRAFATAKLPPPPATLAFHDARYLVVNVEKGKSSVIAYVTDQAALRAYVQDCSEALGLGIVEPHRVYHLTLANAGGGQPRASIGDVWEYPHYPV